MFKRINSLQKAWKFAASLVIAGLLFGGPSSAVDLPIVGGGKGGSPFRVNCPAFFFMVGLVGNTGDVIDHLSIVCETFEKITTGLQPNWKLIPGSTFTDAGVIGLSHGGGPQKVRCGGPRFVSLIRWNTLFFDGNHVAQFIELTCTHPRMVDETVFFGRNREPGEVKQECPPNHWATGLHGRFGDKIDAVALICAPFL
jgi:hypothetical protein